MCMVKNVLLNDDQFKEVMVRDSAAKYEQYQNG